MYPAACASFAAATLDSSSSIAISKLNCCLLYFSDFLQYFVHTMKFKIGYVFGLASSVLYRLEGRAPDKCSL